MSVIIYCWLFHQGRLSIAAVECFNVTRVSKGSAILHNFHCMQKNQKEQRKTKKTKKNQTKKKKIFPLDIILFQPRIEV